MVVVVGSILLLRLHAFLALLLGAFLVAFLTAPETIETHALERGLSSEAAVRLSKETVGERVAEGFGRTAGQIGILIAMASIIGMSLLESGAADRMVRSVLYWIGEKRAPLGLMTSGFFLAIPVFFDTVFYLMIPLGKALRLRTGRHYLYYILAIVAGGTMAHSLVPPTPGPLFVAGELGVDLGLMIITGTLVGLCCAASGYLFAGWADKKWDIPLRETGAGMEKLLEFSRREDAELPRLSVSVLPIVLPVFLISLLTVWDSASAPPVWLVTVGDKNIALSLAALISILLVIRSSSLKETMTSVKSSLRTAGLIILIIGAGGAFGSVLQQTGIGSALEELTSYYELSVLPLAFVLTGLVRTAQGSATVAMITAAGVFSGIADPAQLGFHPVYLALVIGCGSKPIWWMNDSGFWVVSQMSGLTEEESLKTLTPITLVMGIVGLVTVMIGASLFPMV